MNRRQHSKQLIAIVAVWLVGGVAATAGDWPNYRGPNHNGISNEVDWQADWGNAGPKVLWRASVGTGSSSVVIAAGRAYTMGNHGEQDEDQQDSVYCFDAETGKLLWEHTYPCPLLPKYYEGGTLSTPTVDGQVVYTLSKMGDLFALEADTGKVIWHQQLNQNLAFTLPTWHFSSAALILGDRLILNVGSACAAFNKQTGELIWDNGKDICGYDTPVPANVDGQECVVFCGADSIMAVRVDSGELLWRYPFFNKHKATTADVIVRGNDVFASCAYGRGCAKIHIDGGKVTRVFDNTVMSNLQSCSVLLGDQIYGFDERFLKCIDFEDSTERWREKGMGKGTLSMTSDGRMLIMSDTAELVIAKVNSAAFEVLARSRVLPRFTCRTVPVLSNGRVYIRNSQGDVACLDVKSQ
ncbi:MAG: PQQ-binding-like beta-propeller repeat protein [Planctomycetales bacterium]|nr:PQQ-binding-like beta-propeller repeat protein [Planctomycetales bacterium]